MSGIPPVMMEAATARAIEKAVEYESRPGKSCGNCRHYEFTSGPHRVCTLHSSTLGARTVALSGLCSFHARMAETPAPAPSCEHAGLLGAFGDVCAYCRGRRP